jgi:murein DD-endopeptidase MepM/ murein hydrolase activator NlpD
MYEMVKSDELVGRKEILAARLRAANAAGDQSLLETILSAESFTDALADVGYYLDIGDQDKALADAIATDQANLQSLAQTVDDTRAQEDQLRFATANQKVQLDSKLAALKLAKQQLATLQAQTKHQLALQALAYKKLHLSKLAAAEALAKEAKAASQVKQKIADLIAKQFAGGNIPSVYNGTLEWPIAGTITQEFGCTGFFAEPPLGNCAHFHTGIDIADPKYTPIHAAGSGRVVYEGPLSDGAWVVIIAHSEQLVTLYGHLDNRVRPPTVRAGQIVSQGQIIGYVGTTGNTTGPHLHWAVELNGNWVNPRLFL